MNAQLLFDKQKIFYKSGRTRSESFRKEALRRLARTVQNHEHDLTAALQKDLRKCEFESFVSEIDFVLHEIDHTLKNLSQWMKPKKVTTPLSLMPAQSEIHSDPYGVGLIISPWNYPVNLTLTPLVGAIAAGNCAVIKTSELAPQTSAVLAKIIKECFNEDHVALLEGDAKLASSLLALPFDHIFFTGSTRVGKIVMKAAAENLTPVVLELGGKNPCLVLEDADLELAARRITWGKFLNAGQTCIAPDYILVSEKLATALMTLIQKNIHELYGQDPFKSPDYGRIVNKNHFERLAQMIPSHTFCGGQKDEADLYIAPTVFLSSIDSEVMKEEIFGPLLPVITYKSEDEVLRVIEKNSKPLSLYIFSQNEKEQERWMSLVTSGGVCINDCLLHIASPYLPFGGVGASGFQAYHGEFSFKAFSHQKSVLRKSRHLDLSIRYPPYLASSLKKLRFLTKI